MAPRAPPMQQASCRLARVPKRLGLHLVGTSPRDGGAFVPVCPKSSMWRSVPQVVISETLHLVCWLLLIFESLCHKLCLLQA